MSAHSTADRNLLFGILALQMDFITRDQLVAGMNAWVLDKSTALGMVLVRQGTLAQANYDLLAPLVEAHIRQHNNDPEQSLAALTSASSARRDLQKLADPEVQASLAAVGHADPDEDPWATRPLARADADSKLRFRVLRPHAEGGLGRVSVARDEELSREVALKEIKEYYADDAESRTRFLREAEITGGLEHPGVVP